MTRRSFIAIASTAGALSFAAPTTRIPYGKEAEQFGVLRLPKSGGPHPLVVFFHGGFWRNTSGVDLLDPACIALAAAGAATWSLEYRRLGDPGGDWSGMSDDIIRGGDYVPALAKRYNLDPRRVVAAGHSAGGQLALWLAAQQTLDLRGVIGLAAVSDLRRAYSEQLGGGALRQLMGGSPDRIPQRYAAASPAELLPISVPQRLVHGTADTLVPFAMSQRFVKASRNAKLVPLPGANHFDLIDPKFRDWPVIQRSILDWQF